MSSQPKNVFLDNALLKRMEVLGEPFEMTADEMVAAAVNSFLREKSYEDTLSWARNIEESRNLSEDEQMDVAVEAVHQWRAERAQSR